MHLFAIRSWARVHMTAQVITTQACLVCMAQDLKPWSFRVRPFDCDWYTFSDRVLGNPKKFADQAKILQFDVDAAEINKNIRVTSSVIGDVKEILTRINKSSHSLTTIHGLSMCWHMQRLFLLHITKMDLADHLLLKNL